MSFPFDFEAERAERAKRKEFHNSRAMMNKARELLVRNTLGEEHTNPDECWCLLFAEIFTDNGFVYRSVSGISGCKMHRTAMPIRFLTLRPDPEDPISIAKMTFAGITANSSAYAAEMADRPRAESRGPVLTRYRDIELLHEDERVANPERFRPHVYVPRDEEVTPENWMKFI